MQKEEKKSLKEVRKMENMSTIEAIKTSVLLFGGVYIFYLVLERLGLRWFWQHLEKKADQATEIFIDPRKKPWED